MPSLKKVQRLGEIANKSISKCIASFCVKTEELTSDEGSLAMMRSHLDVYDYVFVLF